MIPDEFCKNAIDYVLSNEGGFENDPKDPGGVTNFGISLRFLKTLNKNDLQKVGILSEPSKDIVQFLTEDQARLIYELFFYNKFNYEWLRDQKIINNAFDFHVNAGLQEMIIVLQRALKKDINNLICDGIWGANTRSAYFFYYANHKLDQLLVYFQEERGKFYIDLVNKYPEDKEFLAGWLKRAYRSN